MRSPGDYWSTDAAAARKRKTLFSRGRIYIVFDQTIPMPKIQVRPKPKYDIASWRKNGAENFSNNWCIQRFTMPTELCFVLTVGDMEQRRSPYLQHHSSQRRFYSNDSENNSTENLPVQHWHGNHYFPKQIRCPLPCSSVRNFSHDPAAMGTTVSSIVESCNLQLFCPRASPSVRQLQVGYSSMSHPIVVSRPWLRLFGLMRIIRYFRLVSIIEYIEVVKMVKFKGAVDVE